MGSKSLVWLVTGISLAALCGSAVAAPVSAGAASLLAVPAQAESASFWAKPYPHGYRWRRTPCHVYVWKETGYVKERVRVCR